jgi:hypothetical protein
MIFPRRRSAILASGLLLGAGLVVYAGGCRDEEDVDWELDEEHREAPIPPLPPMPPDAPVPPATPGAPGSLATHYFELTKDGSDRLEANLELALGRVETAIAEDGYLFQAEVMLPSGRLRPRFAARRMGGIARVDLNLDDASLSPRGVRRAESGMWRIYLPGDTPTELSMKLGATQAVIDLTGVPVSNLDLDCGLSRTDLRFESRNPVEMRELNIDAGLSEFRADGLGNARFRRFSFDGGAGRFALDFTGDDLESTSVADIDVGMADLQITLPQGQAVIVETPESPFVSVDVPSGFSRRGGAWRSPEAGDNSRAFRVRVDSGPGRVEVRLAD